MSAISSATQCLSTEAGPTTGRIFLDVRPVVAEERAYFEARFGSGIEADRVGNFYLVHRDAPAADLRSARREDVRSRFRPSRCDHCAEAVTRGGLYLYDSARYAPKELRIVPVDRGAAPRRYRP